jgi:hypothetical protein
MEVEIFD